MHCRKIEEKMGRQRKRAEAEVRWKRVVGREA
jgi:hypothetical protein